MLLLTPDTWFNALAAGLLGYLLGSIPFGLLLTHAAGQGDIRKIGSGNIGATNVLRTGNKTLALATLLLDALKGAGAVALAQSALGGDAGPIAGFAAFLGHLFPVWLGFKGGKGVSTYIGVVLVLIWQAGLAFCVVWLIIAAISRISSLAALIASLATPLAALAWGSPEIALVAAMMSALIFYKHSANIRRLRAGEEPRIGGKAG